MDDAKQTGAGVVVWNKQVSRAAVNHAHQQGLKGWIYTIHEAPRANTLLDLEVDGRITDNATAMGPVLALREPTVSPPPAR